MSIVTGLDAWLHPYNIFWTQEAAGHLYGDSYQIDATGEKVATLGRIHLKDGAVNKVFSASGASISFGVASSTVWTASGSTVRVGLQGINASGVPDGSWLVYKDLVQGTDTLVANTWHTATMSTGSATLSHGDSIAAVIDFTNRQGSDLVRVNGWYTNPASSSQYVKNMRSLAYVTAWNVACSPKPIALITDDGTPGRFFNLLPISSSSSSIPSPGSNPNEIGMGFISKVSFRLSAIIIEMGYNYSAFDLSIYKTPLTNPTLIHTQIFPNLYSASRHVLPLSTEINFERNVHYAIAFKPRDAGQSFAIGNMSLPRAEENYNICIFDSYKYVSRKDSAVFSESDNKLILRMWFHVSGFDDGLGNARSTLAIGL